MNSMLRLCEDVLSDHGAMELPALPRMIFVVHGSVAIADRILRDEEAFGGEGAIMLKASDAGATVWRWELITREADFGRPTPGSGIVSHEKLAVMLSTVPAGALLLRGDSVAFPPGGCAYLHRHQGPGIRCLIEGGIRIDTHGRSTSYGPGGAWYETGPDGRAGRQSPDALYPGDDPAPRLSRQKLGRISQRSRQGEAEVAEL
jgi:hypothetical protein